MQMTPAMLELCKELKYLRSLQLVTRGITHNYNNIFSGLLGNLQMSERSRQKSELDTPTTLVNRAINETEVLFGFARLVETKESVWSFTTIAEEAIRALRTVSPKYSIKLQCHNSFLKVKGLYSDLVLMLFYLVENGIEAMPEGGEVLCEVSMDSDGSRKPWIKVVISDGGPGVDPQITENLFSPFTTTKERDKHHGLGLFFARKTAEDNDGQLDVSTHLSGGGCFILRLPAIFPDELRNIQAFKVTTTQPPADNHTRHVFFVIDDDPNLLDYLVEGLQRKGHIVFSASNCAEVLEEFDNVHDIVTLLLVDIGLTDTDGLACMARLGKQCKLPGLIFMSGDKDIGCSEKFPGALFLSKPFTIRQLEELANNVSTAR
ncbi:hybrid sensor histidine kinase/response regulator [Desulfopila sp. IMCC35008]|uniref:hybrid sensor histidine kinase/response regulator n=1 Tax=Desulfopila sp. IMCC35008 TaxID=2653858 RepID=UPI0013D19CAA|nr:hybrid sensor histidine kinase/response regulator [Desulfopila sp. IMCC35008]